MTPNHLQFFTTFTKGIVMALSDYLTDGEWDACYYAFAGQHRCSNFGESMRKTIDVLLENGYRFSGLTDGGDKARQVPSGNPQKLCVAMGLRPDLATTEFMMKIFESGRAFLKANCPTLVDETDDEWAALKLEAAK